MLRSKKRSLARISRAVFAMTLLVLFAACSSSNDSSGRGLGDGDGDGGGGGGGSGINLTLINNCSGVSLNVLVNANGVWTSGGSTKCAAGQTCAVTPGTYPLDLGSQGLDFFVGSSPDNATKAEVTYLDVLTYDISTISTSGCPESCTSPSCCQNGFNQSLQITTTPSCRCLDCTSVTCPDAYHWPHDDTKQVRCDPKSPITAMTIEFCPASACPSSGFSDCTAAQMAVCANPSDQPCTGNKAICCPESSFGGSHACYCESAEDFCATAPDASSGCGSEDSNYCYVQYEQ